jgi:hypothetical protein
MLTRLAEGDTQKGQGGTMRSRWTWVAWGLLAIFAACLGVGTLLMVVNGEFQRDPASHGSLLLTFTAFMVVGTVIVARRPGNSVGWIFSTIGLLAGTGVLAWQYAEYAYTTRGGSLPGAILGAWYTAWWWYPTVTLATVFTLFVFPTGRLLSARWRPAAWLAGAATMTLTVLAALQPTLETSQGRVISNPIGVAAVGNPEESAVGTALLNLLILFIVVAFVSLVIRFRRSRGDERQQLKWFTYAGALLPLVALGDLLPSLVSSLLFAGLIAFLPAAAGIAILRYRLYDIDRLINRTLVYGLLTALLAGIYAGVVLVLGQMFGGLGAEPPSWAVAGATLAVAALFQPARRRIQAVVDRRFNRRKYDATKTVEAFSARLRDEIDLDTLSAELLAVVDQTMQPTGVSLWLRPPTHRALGTSHSQTGAAPRAG